MASAGATAVQPATTIETALSNAVSSGSLSHSSEGDGVEEADSHSSGGPPSPRLARSQISTAVSFEGARAAGSAVVPSNSLDEESALSAAEADVAGPSRHARAGSTRPCNSLVSTAVQRGPRRDEYACSPKLCRSNSVASETPYQSAGKAGLRGGTPASVYGQLSAPGNSTRQQGPGSNPSQLNAQLSAANCSEKSGEQQLRQCRNSFLADQDPPPSGNAGGFAPRQHSAVAAAYPLSCAKQDSVNHGGVGFKPEHPEESVNGEYPSASGPAIDQRAESGRNSPHSPASAAGHASSKLQAQEHGGNPTTLDHAGHHGHPSFAQQTLGGLFLSGAADSFTPRSLYEGHPQVVLSQLNLNPSMHVAPPSRMHHLLLPALGGFAFTQGGMSASVNVTQPLPHNHSQSHTPLYAASNHGLVSREIPPHAEHSVMIPRPSHPGAHGAGEVSQQSEHLGNSPVPGSSTVNSSRVGKDHSSRHQNTHNNHASMSRSIAPGHINMLHHLPLSPAAAAAANTSNHLAYSIPASSHYSYTQQLQAAVNLLLHATSVISPHTPSLFPNVVAPNLSTMFMQPTSTSAPDPLLGASCAGNHQTDLARRSSAAAVSVHNFQPVQNEHGMDVYKQEQNSREGEGHNCSSGSEDYDQGGVSECSGPPTSMLQRRAADNGTMSIQSLHSQRQDTAHPAASVHATVVAEDVSELETDLSSMQQGEANMVHLARETEYVSQPRGGSISAPAAATATGALSLTMTRSSKQAEPDGADDSSIAVAIQGRSTASGALSGGATCSGTVDMSCHNHSNEDRHCETDTEPDLPDTTNSRDGHVDGDPPGPCTLSHLRAIAEASRGDGAIDMDDQPFEVQGAVPHMSFSGTHNVQLYGRGSHVPHHRHHGAEAETGGNSPPHRATAQAAQSAAINSSKLERSPSTQEGIASPDAMDQEGIASPTCPAEYSASNIHRSLAGGTATGSRSRSSPTHGRRNGTHGSSRPGILHRNGRCVSGDDNDENDVPIADGGEALVGSAQHPVHAAHSATDVREPLYQPDGPNLTTMGTLIMMPPASTITTASQPLQKQPGAPGGTTSALERLPQDTEVHGLYGTLAATAAAAQMQANLSLAAPSTSDVLPQDTEVHGLYGMLAATAAAAQMTGSNGHLLAHLSRQAFAMANGMRASRASRHHHTSGYRPAHSSSQAHHHRAANHAGRTHGHMNGFPDRQDGHDTDHHSINSGGPHIQQAESHPQRQAESHQLNAQSYPGHGEQQLEHGVGRVNDTHSARAGSKCSLQAESPAVGEHHGEHHEEPQITVVVNGGAYVSPHRSLGAGSHHRHPSNDAANADADDEMEGPSSSWHPDSGVTSPARFVNGANRRRRDAKRQKTSYTDNVGSKPSASNMT